MFVNRLQFEQCLPFYFCVSSDGLITDLGKSLSKIVGSGTIGKNITETFEFRLPAVEHPIKFDMYLNQFILVEHKQIKIKLVGQIIKLDSDQKYLFAVGTQLHDMQIFTQYGIDFSDFPPQEQVFDFLMAFHSYKKSEIDAHKLNQELQKQKNIALETSNMKSRFLANMSHELRTPLNAVIGLASVLSYNLKSNSEEKEQVDIILSSGEHLLSLINDILDISKIEAGFVKITPIQVTFRLFLEELIDTLDVLALKKANVLSYEISDNVPDVLFLDPVRVRQIITNILGNSIKFTENGKINIRCSLLSKVNDVVDIEFVVTDTGYGIPENMLEKIFIPFIQVNQNNQAISGTGLGLSITKQLINSMNGDIRVISEVGKGTEFTFNLLTKSVT